MAPLTDDDDEPLPLCVQGGHLRLEPAVDGDQDFDPAEVTRLIGLEPTWTRHRLDDGVPPYTASGWWIDLPRRAEFNTEVLVREILDIIEPHASGLAQARRRFGLSAGIYICVEVYQMLGSPRLQLPATTLRRLAALDVWLDCEQDLFY
ncbi:DUF4279 domain-containing protein [Dactylosporangium siamense]|uniref:DUF4279 domain-containing protein n=1 Tax=Dactylosporangium siamense TaxID=685454 RepID=A0A919UD48_9ACTN|nr:DUF4279 domain-containing protein [Dactylosporangium siamense]GIG51072.1 hypothetical protein Dsi01nite_091130 [Dactylosporangium siamense]